MCPYGLPLSPSKTCEPPAIQHFPKCFTSSFFQRRLRKKSINRSQAVCHWQTSRNLETQKSRGSWFASTKRGDHPSIWRPAKASKKCCRAILKSLKVEEKKWVEFGPVDSLGVGTCTNQKKTFFGKNNHRLKAALKLEKIFKEFFLSNLEILVCKLFDSLKSCQGNAPERPVTTSTVRSGLGSLEVTLGKTV